ncbi:MAG: hypothetical protein ACKODM_16655 [Cytophagales bacterium]
MDIDKNLELLRKIHPVDAPPFLFTRIKASIDSATEEKVSVKWNLSFAIVALIVLTLNVSAFFVLLGKQRSEDIEDVINLLELSNSNALYHE